MLTRVIQKTPKLCSMFLLDNLNKSKQKTKDKMFLIFVGMTLMSQVQNLLT